MLKLFGYEFKKNIFKISLLVLLLSLCLVNLYKHMETVRYYGTSGYTITMMGERPLGENMYNHFKGELTSEKINDMIAYQNKIEELIASGKTVLVDFWAPWCTYCRRIDPVLNKMADAGVKVYNLGTGVGYSVFDLLKAFESATGIKIPYKVTPRRTGDIGECWSDPSKAEKELGWKAVRTLEEMCKSAWEFEKNN